ncbi:hypothetical protein [Amycolatopsis kentuckyensis]|uniref:hypothetical protein n=1 Tax=Amycolatopsis kentuckyensis TaxID=218823 RepID=UPI00356A5B30
MPEYDTTKLSVCVDCIQLLANGEINDGEDTAERCAEGQVREWGDNVMHMTYSGEELGFSWTSCDGCGSSLGGDRYRAYMMIPLPAAGK